MKKLFIIFIAFTASITQAIDSKGILAVVVQVVDESGDPVEGAVVTLPQVEITKLKDTAKNLGLSPLVTAHACHDGTTDKLGFALIYYSGGTQSTSTEYACSLPDSIEVRQKGKAPLTIDLSKRGMMIVKPSESVVPHITATLTAK